MLKQKHNYENKQMFVYHQGYLGCLECTITTLGDMLGWELSLLDSGKSSESGNYLV